MTTSLLFAAATFYSGILVPVIAMAIGPIIVFTALYFKNQRRRFWHETARVALEKGQPLPADPEEGIRRQYDGARSPLRDVRTALILLAVSAGLYLSFRENERQMLVGCYITGCIGIALLISAALTALFRSKSSDQNTRPPQA
jgi:hypothetical protein